MTQGIPAKRFVAALGLLALGACSAPAGTESFQPADSFDRVLANVEERPEDWLTHGRNYGETRFSPLNQIHRGNVNRLGPAWVFETGTDRGLEATPLVVDGTIYTTGSWSIVYAIDGRTGQQRWRFDPQVDRARGQLACCDVVNRGAAYYDGKVYVGALDGRLIAIDAATGQSVWETLTFDQSKDYTITGAPRVVDGKVIIGNGGAEYGVRGYVSAYDAQTGEMAWRFYIVPGNPADGFETPDMERAARTWTGEWWRYGGGGTAWDHFAYDPELKLVYVGTGNGSPWNQFLRSPGGGDNLYLASIVALDVETGRVRWHYQTTPGDTWDYTATAHMILTDLEIDGRTRRVIMQAPKNGFFYVLDRETGEFSSAETYTTVTWATGIDPRTGRPIEAPGARYEVERQVIKPGPLGGHNWHPMSYSPQTGLVYIPVQDNSFVYAQDPEFNYEPGVWNTGTDFSAGAGIRRDPPTGSLVAWDPVRQEPRWTVAYDDMWNGGVLSTAGGLVFQGTNDGRFVAYDAETGRSLWEVKAAAGIIAAPVTYMIDGVQYVAVMAGWGGSYGLTGGGRRPFTEGRLFVFRLDGDAP
ncbi:MAG TPA: PQQ-dependent dehydrogenase, methanol/ethanol family, partial [Longimicrobiaceae bacterium]|nr:PQQ-dependent dehydrogenase, methanol/ethanol family [Longimicrobiaceae bacterium]